MALPHLKNSQAGVNRYDPVNKSIFEVYFTIPAPLQNEFGKDVLVLTEHVQNISGLEALYRAPETDKQKFMGTDRSFIKPTVGDTRAELEIEFSLNLRNGTDNYIAKLLRAWAALGWDLNTGKRVLKKDYCADWLKVSIANRAGDIFQEIVFKDVMMNGAVDIDGGLDYTADDAVVAKAKFVSDWWEETVA